MKQETLKLTKIDFDFLVDTYFNRNISLFNKVKLSNELLGAKIIDKEWLPANVVCTNSTVLVHNVAKAQTFNVRIISTDADKINTNDISVNDPLAIALLGYSSGSVVEWEMEDGLNRFQVISVLQEDVIK